MESHIETYYEKLAPKYDANRFGNSYGSFIHEQEIAVLKKNLKEHDPKTSLDLACGTGRLMQFSDTGLDISPAMVKISSGKFPSKKFQIGNALNTQFPNKSFQTIICFHFLMHLDERTTGLFLKEAFRLLKPGGHLIFDIPSKHRRIFTNHHQKGWHGANDLTVGEILSLTCRNWILRKYEGIMFFPIHRMPVWIRAKLRWIDSLFCKSIFRKNASYLIFKLEKKWPLNY